MKIKKISGLLSPLGKILNLKSSSQEDTYSCDYINKLNEYSEEETVIGKWIDGKPLYRKIIYANVPTANTNVIITHNLNIDNLVKVYGNCDVNGGTTNLRPFPFIQIVSTNAQGFTVYGASSNDLTLRASWNNNSAKLILEYTKITD